MTPSPSRSRTTSSEPHRVGGSATAGGGTWAPTVFSSRPMKPSAVQLATPMRPPGRQTRTSSAAARSWSAVNMTPIAETTKSNDSSSNGSASASATSKSMLQVLGRGAAPGGLDELLDVVDAGDVAEGAGGLDGDVAGPGRDVQDRAAGTQPDAVAQPLGERDGDPGDLAVVAVAPDLVLLGLELLEGADGLGGVGHGGSSWCTTARDLSDRAAIRLRRAVEVPHRKAMPISRAPAPRSAIGLPYPPHLGVPALARGWRSPTRPARPVPSVASMTTLMAQHYADGVRLLERERELDVLREGLQQVRGGQGAGFAIAARAAPGSPRPSPLRSARPTGLRVVRGQCDPLRTPRPLGPFRELGLPGLAALVSAEEARLMETAEAALTELGSEPTVLVIEDLHWADAASTDVLRYLARRVETVPLAILLSYRDLEIGPDTRPASSWATSPPWTGCARCRCSPSRCEAVTQAVEGTGLDPTPRPRAHRWQPLLRRPGGARAGPALADLGARHRAGADRGDRDRRPRGPPARRVLAGPAR